MRPTERFTCFKRGLRQQLGSQASARDILHASSMMQILEMASYEIAIGRHHDLESIAAVQQQLQISLTSARSSAPAKTTRNGKKRSQR
jgi:hypothetical protein